MKYLALLLIFPYLAKAITIQQAEVVGDGSDEDSPLVEGDDLTLRCTADSEWSLCMWIHEIEDLEDSNGNTMTMTCQFSSTHNGEYCTNIGGSDELDDSAKRRVQAIVQGNSCGLRIRDSEATDGGTWKCRMNDGTPYSAWAEVEFDAFVSNQSTIFITEPDLWSDSSLVISYEIDKTNTEIEATCTAYGGNPEPKFHWYVGDDDDDSEITDHTARKVGPSSDDLGDYVAEQMSWSPTRDDLCEFDATSDDCEEDQFTFPLICKVVQESNGEYYRDENMQQMKDVVVEVTNSSSMVISSLLLVSFALMTVLH